MSDKKLDMILDEIGSLKREILRINHDGGSQWMDVPGLAKYLSCSTSLVYKLVESKKIPFYRVGGTLRFRQNEIDQWIMAGEVSTISRRVKKILTNNPKSP